MRNHLIFFMIVTLIGPFAFAAEEKEKETTAKEEISSNNVFRVQIRVIFAGKTGIYGSVPRELRDMKPVLTDAFKYPSYELSNTIRLSFFGDEEATAMVFPEHYIRIHPRGTTKNGQDAKLKVELFNLPRESNITTKFYVPQPNQNPDSKGGDFTPIVGVEEKLGERQPLLPIVSSAIIASTKYWEAFGGVPVHVNAQNRVTSNRGSNNPFSSSGAYNALGKEQYLILGLKLERME